MKIGKLLIGILLLSFLACKTNNSSKNPIVQKNPTEYAGMRFPKPIGYVNDFENILSIEEISELEKLISNYEKNTTKEIAIVTTDSISPFDNIHRFSTEIASDWAIGKMEKNNGLIIVVSKNLRQTAISTGYGTEKILTDFICKKTIDSVMIPEFKKDEFYNGIKKGLIELISEWK